MYLHSGQICHEPNNVSTAYLASLIRLFVLLTSQKNFAILARCKLLDQNSFHFHLKLSVQCVRRKKKLLAKALCNRIWCKTRFLGLPQSRQFQFPSFCNFSTLTMTSLV